MKCQPLALVAVLRSIGAGLGPFESHYGINVEDKRQYRSRGTNDGSFQSIKQFQVAASRIALISSRGVAETVTEHKFSGSQRWPDDFLQMR